MNWAHERRFVKGLTRREGVVSAIVAALIITATFVAHAPATPREDAREAVKTCWRAQEASYAGDVMTQRCERLEANFRVEYGVDP